MSIQIYKNGVPDTYISLSNFYAFSRASRASSLLLMKTTFYVLCYRKKQYATKLIDAKRKFMELMIRKPLYFC